MPVSLGRLTVARPELVRSGGASPEGAIFIIGRALEAPTWPEPIDGGSACSLTAATTRIVAQVTGLLSFPIVVVNVDVVTSAENAYSAITLGIAHPRAPTFFDSPP